MKEARVRDLVVMGIVLGMFISFLILTGCVAADVLLVPTLEPLPTYTAAPPLPTLEPLPTDEADRFVVTVAGGQSCYLSEDAYFEGEEADYKLGDGTYSYDIHDSQLSVIAYRIIVEAIGTEPITCWIFFEKFTPTEWVATDVPATVEPTLTPIPPTAAPTTGFVRVFAAVSRTLARQVCFNINGFIYNAKGFPVLSDCIYPLKGEVKDRLKFVAGERVEVELFGDAVFKAVHGFYTHNGTQTIRADGGQSYYILAERGANGELLYIAAWEVKLLIK